MNKLISSEQLEEQMMSDLWFKRELKPFIHLQWFADDDEDAPGRTEEPTEERIRKLREEGQVVKSQELIAALSLLLPALLILFLAPFMFRSCVEMIRFYFLRAAELDPVKDLIVAGVFFRYLAMLATPIMGVALFSVLFANITQIGFLFTTKPIEPDITRILPRFGKFFSRIFSVDGLYNFFKSIIKMLIIGLVAFFLIRSDINKLTNLQKAGLWQGFTTVAWLAIKLLLMAAFLMLVLAIPDYIFQRWRFRERNRMTKQQIKEELKQTEGDPMIQGRIRARFRELLRQNLAATVPQADVVITNPTHIAVALKCDRRTMTGPMIIAMGADELAARIRNIAQENEVPLVENKPLAQALYKECDVGQIIPQAYFETVALILVKVWKLDDIQRVKMSA
jgi:flagellar biosynthetic protein FlhB